jgi:hypothetical protein
MAAPAMKSMIRPVTTVTVDDGTPATICRLIPPDVSSASSAETAMTASIDPRASRPTTRPVNP